MEHYGLAYKATLAIVVTFLLATAGILLKFEEVLEPMVYAATFEFSFSAEAAIAGIPIVERRAHMAASLPEMKHSAIVTRVAQTRLQVEIRDALANLTLLPPVLLTDLVSSTVSVTTLEASSKRLQPHASVLNLLAELLKLFFSVLFFFTVPTRGPKLSDRTVLQALRHSLLYSVPAALYVVDNNLFFVVVGLIGPVKFHLFNNLKVVVTAILFRVFLKRRLHVNQWVALLVLFVGVIVTQQADILQKGQLAEGTTVAGLFSSPVVLFGFLLVLIMVTCSSFASIWAEYMYKRDDSENFYMQNIQLYFYGAALNAVAFLVRDYWVLGGVQRWGFFGGFTYLSPLIILGQAVCGFSIAHMLKVQDNITSVFCHAAALLLTVAAVVVFFGFRPSILFFCGSTTVIASMFLYKNSHHHHHGATQLALQPMAPHGEDEELRELVSLGNDGCALRGSDDDDDDVHNEPLSVIAAQDPSVERTVRL
eukprot:TRINITY_DN22021_c0_g1_i1.p1 TRINITY_DN22021_c0_g1~~TRINITY_DN22021_c0_g1_i1.p1  ORF type:complete len:480 (-),score=72.74 TRINITY_DN22021_c0_g1_i1:20-1459(-)